MAGSGTVCPALHMILYQRINIGEGCSWTEVSHPEKLPETVGTPSITTNGSLPWVMEFTHEPGYEAALHKNQAGYYLNTENSCKYCLSKLVVARFEILSPPGFTYGTGNLGFLLDTITHHHHFRFGVFLNAG